MGYTEATIDHPGGGSYRCLAPDSCLSVELPDEQDSPPLPRPLFHPPGWGICVGTGAAMRSRYAAAMTQGSALIIHDIPASGSSQPRVRYILFAGTGATIWLLGASGQEQLAQMQYVDVNVPPAGGVPSFGMKDDFDRDSTEGSKGIVDEIERVCAQRNFPFP